VAAAGGALQIDAMINDWRVYRPAIWLGMLGVCALLVLNAYLGAVIIGGGIGVGLRIHGRRRRAVMARGSRSEASVRASRSRRRR
jgi:hypothetical protein